MNFFDSTGPYAMDDVWAAYNDHNSCSMSESISSSKDDDWVSSMFSEKNTKTASDVILKDQLITDASLGVKRPIKSEHSYSMLVSSSPASPTIPDDNQHTPNYISSSIINQINQLKWINEAKRIGLQTKIDEMDEECFPAVSMNTASGRDSSSLQENSGISSSSIIVKTSCASVMSSELQDFIIKGEPISEPNSPAPESLNLSHIEDSKKSNVMVSPHSIHFTDVKALQTDDSDEMDEELYENIDLEYENKDTEKIVNQRVSSQLLPPTPPCSASSDSEGLRSASCSPQHRYSQNQTIVQSVRAYPYSRVFVATTGHSGRQPIQTNLISTQQKGSSGKLELTEEEKRTLIAEGYPVPTKMPLSKQEEKSLKKIRRKIKNKISAQESRRKKKEYMDGLERRVTFLTNENSSYKNRLIKLENTNSELLEQLKRLQEIVNGQTS